MLAEQTVTIPNPPITGIAWLDAVISIFIAAIAAGLLRFGWMWLSSTMAFKKAKEQHAWIANLEPLVASAINETEKWAKEQPSTADSEAKLRNAISMLKEKAVAAGVPSKLLDEVLLKGFIESKLATGNLSTVSETAKTKVILGDGPKPTT